MKIISKLDLTDEKFTKFKHALQNYIKIKQTKKNLYKIKFRWKTITFKSNRIVLNYN